MQITEALSALNDGHTIWKVGYAKRVCKALNVPFDGSLIERFHSEAYPKGAHMLEGQEGSLGIYSLNLSHHIARGMGLLELARGFRGRGSQAREYARVVKEAWAGSGKV